MADDQSEIIIETVHPITDWVCDERGRPIGFRHIREVSIEELSRMYPQGNAS